LLYWFLMLKWCRYLLNRISGKNIHFLITLFILILFTTSLSGSAKASYVPPWSSSPVSIAIISPLIQIIIIAQAIVLIIIVFYNIRLRKVNRQLSETKNNLTETNNNLQKAYKELLSQRDLISKEYSESDKFYQMLIQSADDGISFFDPDWTLKYANPAYYSLVGLDSVKFEDVRYEELVHPDDRNYQKQRIEILNETGFFETELRVRHANGNFINISTRSVTVKNNEGEILGSLTISRDITKLKQVHEELIKANVEAETSNRLKTSFLANISHEIRTPLNSVVGFSNLLLANDISKESKEEYIEHINHNSEKLLQIIGDIIDLSRLENSQIEISYEEASLNSIISEIIEETRQVIRRNEKSIMLNVRNQFEDSGDLIFTDRIWLKRVLNHLLDNAVKFTLDGSIEFSYYRENADIIFKIKDTGIGINKENLDHIFEEFRQEFDGHHRPFEGLGIGLTLAKEVVERMGGKINVESEKGIGSEFRFSIPYRPAGSIKGRMKSFGTDLFSAPINWSSQKCLIVDDNKDVLIYLSRILQDTEINLITARSGFEAIEIVKNTPDLDIILLDMQMPEMNGIEATKEIRKINKNIPIIAQTAFIFENDKDIILEAGCDACLFKPIRKEHLLSVITGFIKDN
jgi:PAS domain S-box-containing protein